MEKKKIKTYGHELIFLGFIFFAGIILVSLATYQFYLKQRAQQSVEFRTAKHFIHHSASLKDHLLTELEEIDFQDLRVVEQDDYGVCEITFSLKLKYDLKETVRVGLVKVADYWIVYRVTTDPDTDMEYSVTSTYDKILFLLEKLSLQDYQNLTLMLDIIEPEIFDDKLKKYLKARVDAVTGNIAYATRLLDQLLGIEGYSKVAIMFERAMIDFSLKYYENAIKLLQAIVLEIATQETDDAKLMRMHSLFSGLPKDLFIASFLHSNILTDVYQNLALAYYQLSDYQKGLDNANLAIQKATETKSIVAKSSALFIRALNLYALQKFQNADEAFSDVINDLNNTNLTQKAWSYYYKAEVAARFGRAEDSLDYFETAVGLDPFNYPIRKATIEYLLNRYFEGDLEIALGLALRGVDYGIEKETFKNLASLIYTRLGMADKTKWMD
jgi:tetratricopeptide (TPR) repeat protein